MTVYARCAGLRLESLGESWAVYNARSGDTLNLNNEAAAVLEVLAQGPMDEQAVSATLGDASGTDADRVSEQLLELWPQLVALGFIDEVA